MGAKLLQEAEAGGAGGDEDVSWLQGHAVAGVPWRALRPWEGVKAAWSRNGRAFKHVFQPTVFVCPVEVRAAATATLPPARELALLPAFAGTKPSRRGRRASRLP